MKDYKRLTERDDSLCIDCADIGFCRKTCIRQARYERLQFLENEIEDGEIDYVSDRDKEIACLTAENQRLREEAAKQKSIAAHEHATQMEWFRIACDYKAKNAIELPCVKAVKTKEWIDKVEVGDTIWEWAVVYIDRQGEFVVEPCRSKTAAEVRLKELKENNND